MSKTISKQVANRGDIAKTVVTSAELHGAEIVAQLEELLFPEGVPSSVTLSTLITTLGQALTRSTESMLEADVKLYGESSDTDRARAERDEVEQSIRSMLINLRDVVQGVYGTAAVKACGLQGDTPLGGEELCNHAKNVMSQLRRDLFADFEPKMGMSELKTKNFTDALEIEVSALDDALAATKREAREYQLALEDRDAKVAKWSTVYRGVAEALSAFFVLGGRPELADRVRPTVRRTAGKIDDAILTANEPPTGGPTESPNEDTSEPTSSGDDT